MFFSLFNIPTDFEIFLDNKSVCIFQFNWSSIMIPSRLKFLTRDILTPSMNKFGIVTFLFLMLNIINLVFPILRESLFTLSHSDTLLNS